MSQSAESKTCGDPECFYCHFNKAIRAFAPGDSEDFTPEQSKEITRVIVQAMGIMLSNEPDELTMAFFQAVIDAKRAEERATRAQANSVALFMAMFGFDPTAGKKH